MYSECLAELAMKRIILGESYFDESKHKCKVLKYNLERERIYLLSEEAELPAYSLDALYECSIYTEDIISCQGYIRERYMSKIGKVLVFEIENGFYKNPVN